MAVIGAISLPANHKRWFTINYPWLQTGETIVTATATVTGDDASYEVHDTQIDNEDRQIHYLAGGAGTDGAQYLVAVRVQTNLLQDVTDHVQVTIDNGGV